jgi:acetyltransferase
VPLLVCVLGETTGAPHRRLLAEAGLPVFATPETAVAAFVQLVRQRQARAAAMELPPRRVLDLAPDHAAVARVIAAVRAEGRDGLMQDEALAVLAAYGLPVVPSRVALDADQAVGAAGALGFPVVAKRRRATRPLKERTGGLVLDVMNAAALREALPRLDPVAHGYLVQHQAGRSRELRITAGDDPVFGPAIGFGLGGSAADLLGDAAFDLPPLNQVLARSLIARTRAGLLMRAGSDHAQANKAAVADAVVRVSQLLIDYPEIAALDINPLFVDAAGVCAADAWIGLRPSGETASFAISAYPAELAQSMLVGSETLLIRPIRPEDAEAHAALFRRLTPEDVRYRFFNMLRELSPEQIVRMTQVDYEREMAFVAVRDATGETVGVCRLVREPNTDRGEFAVVVEPAMKGHGLARRLMGCVMDWGRGRGMTEIIGQVLAENQPMLGFMRRIGATIRRMPDEPDVVEAVIPLY